MSTVIQGNYLGLSLIDPRHVFTMAHGILAALFDHADFVAAVVEADFVHEGLHQH